RRRPGQRRLEPDLRDEDALRRADFLDALVDEAEVPLELLAAQGLDRHDRAVLDELRLGYPLDLRFQPDGPVVLHRPLRDGVDPRMDGGTGVALEQERGNAVMPEEDRGREPDQTPADDQNRRLFVHHSLGGIGYSS